MTRHDYIYDADDITVVPAEDPQGAVWRPDADTTTEIQSSKDPEEAAIAMVLAAPMRGTWYW